MGFYLLTDNFRNEEYLYEHKYTKNETFTKGYPKVCLKLYQLCHILKIPFVIEHF